MRMTVKGQVTIPGAIRRKLNLLPGDDVNFTEEGDKVVVFKTDKGGAADRARFERRLDAFQGIARGGAFSSTDEALDFLRGSDRQD